MEGLAPSKKRILNLFFLLLVKDCRKRGQIQNIVNCTNLISNQRLDIYKDTFSRFQPFRKMYTLLLCKVLANSLIFTSFLIEVFGTNYEDKLKNIIKLGANRIIYLILHLV